MSTSSLKNVLRIAGLFFALPLGVGAQGNPPGEILSLPFVGEQRVLFIRVKYPGDTHGILTDEAIAQRAETLRDAFQRNSYGNVSLTLDITPELTLPQPLSYYQRDAALETLARLRADALVMAKQAGFDVESYDREIIYSAHIWNAPTGMGTINTHTAFLGGGNAYLDAHELGHSLDWVHANFWQVGQGQSPISPQGDEIAYGDAYDIMGDQRWGQHPAREFHHFNPWYKSRVGWIPSENILTVTESDTFLLQACAIL